VLPKGFIYTLACTVENEEHCDFVALREALLRVNVEDLRVRTHTYLYEQFRRERLQSMGLGDGGTGPKMAEIIAQVCYYL
jgi:septin family protein